MSTSTPGLPRPGQSSPRWWPPRRGQELRFSWDDDRVAALNEWHVILIECRRIAFEYRSEVQVDRPQLLAIFTKDGDVVHLRELRGTTGNADCLKGVHIVPRSETPGTLHLSDDRELIACRVLDRDGNLRDRTAILRLQPLSDHLAHLRRQ